MYMNLTNSLMKYVISLSRKKVREEEGCFVAEGTKCVRDTWDYFNCRMIIATKAWYDENGHSGHLDKIVFANSQQMQRMSQMSTATDVIAVYDIPERTISEEDIRSGLNVVLENIQDPGNVGTVIRTADALGMDGVVLSEGSCDLYSLKVLRAAMGSAFRLPVLVTPMEAFLRESGLTSFASVVDTSAPSILDTRFPSGCILLIGNEGNGLSDEQVSKCTHRVTIPMKGRAESFNAAMAATIFIWEMARGMD